METQPVPFELPAEAVVIIVVLVAVVVGALWTWERWRRGGRNG